MLSVESALLSRFAPAESISRRDALALVIITLLHLSALVVMTATELDLATKATFLVTWALLNFFWLAVLRRPSISALLSLGMVVALILLSQFKYDKLMMTVNFVDLMIIDPDTSAFLFTIMPRLRGPVIGGALVASPLLAVLGRIDPFRIRVRTSALGGTMCMGALVILSTAYPADLYGEFFNRDYVSKFARSGVDAVYEFATHGLLESDAIVADRLKVPAAGCNPAGKLPHIILPGYQRHFQSFDGVPRKLVVEGAGGPSWFTEYNVLTGLSARSYGRFATSVTRIAAGRVGRGLPHSLSQCGYKTFSLYPFYGAFLGSRTFQTTAGIERYFDIKDLGTSSCEADSFYFSQAIRIIEHERGNGPLFLYVYTV